MKNILYTQNHYVLQAAEKRIFRANALFLDIETTGFTARTSGIYLIGMCFPTEDGYVIRQLLAENSSEEKQLLTAFLDLLAGYDRIISFNGRQFDLPFLQKRCDRYKIPADFSAFEQVDIFRYVSKLKPLLDLHNYKQKTLEYFIGNDRQDMYTGGDLIRVYHEYEKLQDPEAEKLLLLHNFEDVKGMLSLLSLFDYESLLTSPLRLIHSDILQITDAGGNSSFILKLVLQGNVSVIKSVHWTDILHPDLHQAIRYTMMTNQIILEIPVYRGILNYYYPNYRDYYYLTAEKRIVHKDLGQYVDKEYRRKCKAEECFIPYEGIFLPEYREAPDGEQKPDESKYPVFSAGLKEKICYFEFKREMLEDESFLTDYAVRLLAHEYRKYFAD